MSNIKTGVAEGAYITSSETFIKLSLLLLSSPVYLTQCSPKLFFLLSLLNLILDIEPMLVPAILSRLIPAAATRLHFYYFDMWPKILLIWTTYL